jgi:predicted amidohydrolase YtcJ
METLLFHFLSKYDMKFLLLSFSFIYISVCYGQESTLYHHGYIYTVDSAFKTVDAMVIENGVIKATGSYKTLATQYPKAAQIDLKKQFVYPGFIDAHCHFFGLGLSMQIVDLIGTKSANDAVQKCLSYQKEKPKKYIMGRGWDQNDWAVKEYPNAELLDQAFPDIPVVLKRIDGHAAWVNHKALQMSGVTERTVVTGGEIILKNGKPSGILIDNAVDLVMNVIPNMTEQEIQQACMEAEKVCLSKGLTYLVDAGLEYDTLAIISKLYRDKKLSIGLDAMYAGSSKNLYKINHHEYIQNEENFKAWGIKIYADGALGSRGACLRAPYADRAEEHGFMLFKGSAANDQLVMDLFKAGYEQGMPMNVHCIGDSANHYILNEMAKYLNRGTDLRWRIEHAQVTAPSDLDYYSTFKIIPSVQPTHATSDMYWAEDRLGKSRIGHAYTYKSLLKKAGMIALGTDFPVEAVNPLYTFTSAVWRMDAHSFPKGGFQKEEGLTREETLKGMTIWAAWSVSEEKYRGSLETGKRADFIILNKDLMKCSFKEAREAKVLGTFISGKKVY